MWLPPDVPCVHSACLSHVTHPCEGCGRTAGRYPENDLLKIAASALRKASQQVHDGCYLYWSAQEYKEIASALEAQLDQKQPR